MQKRIGFLVAAAVFGFHMALAAELPAVRPGPAAIDDAAKKEKPEGTTGKKPAEVKLQIKDFDGIQALIKGHKGKIVVMDAWATWCPPCVKEFPNLVKLHKKYGPEKIACVSLSFDFDGIGKPEEQMPRVQKFLVEQGATFDNIISNEEADVLYKKMELDSVPAIFVYDKTGKLVDKFTGHTAYEKVLTLVEKLNSEPK